MDNLQLTRDSSKEKRINFLDRLATKYALQNNLTQEKAVRELLAYEQIRDIFQDIRMGLMAKARTQTYKIWLLNSGDVTDPPPENWKKSKPPQVEITNSDDTQSKILERNLVHLQQAKEKPFTMTKLGKLLRWEGSGDLVDQLLEGTVPEDLGLSKVSMEYLNGLKVQKMNVMEKIKADLTMEEYKSFWLKKGSPLQRRRSASM